MVLGLNAHGAVEGALRIVDCAAMFESLERHFPALNIEGAMNRIERDRPKEARERLERALAMARENLEETGFRCNRWHQVAPFRLMLNREDVIEYFYIGLGGRRAPDYELRERGTVRLFERADFLDLVRSRRFEQGAALGGLYLAEKILGVDLLRSNLDQIAERLAGQG